MLGMTSFGVFVGNDPNAATQFENWVGRDVDFVAGHGNDSSWNELINGLGWTAHQFKSVAPVKWTVPMLVKGTTLSQGAWGAYDQNYRQVAEKLLAISPGQSEITVRVGQEFNGNWFAWGAKGQESAYISTFRHFVDTFRSVSDKFVFEWNVNAGDMGMDPATAYPGNGYVDVIGMDFYYNTRWDPKDPAKAWDYMIDRKYGLQWLEDFADAHGKPTAYSEWSVNSDNAQVYIAQAAKWFESHDVLYQSYWNSNADFPGMLSNGQYANTGAAFKAAFSEDASGTTQPDTTPAEPAESANWQVWMGGTGGNDRLTGDWHHDKIDGGGGADTMTGGKGDDIYTVDRKTDTVVEKAGEGVDTIDSYSNSYTLPDNVEHLSLVASYGQTGIGNALANRIAGGASGNVINGRGGNDWLTGGGGRDTFVFQRDAGHDTITDFQVSGSNSDRIDVRGLGFGSFAAIKSAMQDSGNHVTIDLPGSGYVTLAGVHAGQFGAEDFLL